MRDTNRDSIIGESSLLRMLQYLCPISQSAIQTPQLFWVYAALALLFPAILSAQMVNPAIDAGGRVSL